MTYLTIQEFFAVGMSRTIPDLVPPPDGEHLNLGGTGGKPLPLGTLVLDYPDWDAESGKLPYVDEQFAAIHAYHFFEHVSGGAVIKLIAECQRVLVPGGVIYCVVPYYSTNMMAHDLTHKTAFCEETWRNLFSDPSYDRPGAVPWRLRVGVNLIIGIVERNLCLMTQLIKEPS